MLKRGIANGVLEAMAAGACNNNDRTGGDMKEVVKNKYNGSFSDLEIRCNSRKD